MKARIPKHYDSSNKQNIHPNIQLLSTEDQSKELNKLYPKVSCFKTSNYDSEVKDWKKRIMGVSDRQKALNNKLARMLSGNFSPVKIDKIVTEAASYSHCSQKQLENTLRRYLYQRSNISMGFSEANLTEMIEELHKTTEEITGSALPVDNSSNPEDVLCCVLQALKEYQNFKSLSNSKPKTETVQNSI